MDLVARAKLRHGAADGQRTVTRARMREQAGVLNVLVSSADVHVLCVPSWCIGSQKCVCPTVEWWLSSAGGLRYPAAAVAATRVGGRGRHR